MSSPQFLCPGLAISLALACLSAEPPSPIRPPATPLIVHDPYFSIWSFHDRLTDGPARHWTGAPQPLAGLIRVDGAAYRFAGDRPRGTPAMAQTGFELTPTRSIYHFEGGGLHLDFTFFTPAFPSDLDILSRPATYLIWDVRSTDGRTHAVSVYFDASARIAVNTPDQRVACSRLRAGEMEAIRAGSTDQSVLAKSGDDLRIDWGYLYLTAPAGELRTSSPRAAQRFVETGLLPENDELDQTDPYRDDPPVLAAKLDFGRVSGAAVSRYALLAYDDIFSIEYFQRRLRPYWRRNGMDAAGLLRAAVADYPALLQRAKKFDEELAADLVHAGGPKYAALAIAAYRQTLAAHKLVADVDGRPLYFSKENFSNGSIDTVDVTYPSSPFFLLLNPSLLEAQLVPVLEYAAMSRWRWPYAPHDLGRYPLADGQGYGGGETSEENQMPVEESGNMLIMIAALAKAEGNASLAEKYWPILSRWAGYLGEKGLDPENQLCTDDFAGHLAHNTNLSLKAILALRSYSELAAALGKTPEAERYLALSRNMAANWTGMAADGGHYRLAFDKPGTWSQKYNLVWDNLLGYHLFPASIARDETAFYQTKRNEFGLPLDNREAYTKLDWLIWAATLAGDLRGFESIADAGYRFANETPTRVPLSDWYSTTTGKQVGFQARSVVGGVFIKMLDDPATWKKWSSR